MTETVGVPYLGIAIAVELLDVVYGKYIFFRKRNL